MPLTINPQALPNDVASLQALIGELLGAFKQSQRHVQQLQHRLAQLLKWRFGSRSDKLDPAQLLLFAREMLAPVEPADAPPPCTSPSPRAKPNGHGRRRLPANLPRRQVVHDLSEDEKRCPCCGEPRVRIGQESSEQLECEPAQLYILEHIRPTYACRHCQANVETASKPSSPIEKGLAAPGLLAHVITSKYSDHLPLYRQEDILARAGVAIARSTTCGWMASCAALVRPFVERMKALVLASKLIHTDDTPVPVLDPPRGRTREGRMWVYVGDAEHPYTVFDYTPTRARDGPTRFFGDYAGYIQADAYGGYDHLFKARSDAAPSPREVGCWAHARRKFVEAQSSDALRACAAVGMIKRLYEVEREARGAATEAAAQAALEGQDEAMRVAHLRGCTRQALFTWRQEKSLPRLAQIKTWLEENRPQVLPRSPMGEAITYCLNNWAALTRYVEDGDLAIDNNPAENALRSIVLGRKNWLFAGSDEGGRTGAVLASLVISCKRHDVDPFAYLRDVLTRIADTPVSQLDQFLPDRWRAACLRSST